MLKEEIISSQLERIINLLGTLANQSNSNSSVSAEILLSLVPIISIIFGCTILFFFFLWQYRIKKELIKANIYENYFLKNIKFFLLLVGLLSSMVGFPMTMIILYIQGISYALLGGTIPLFTGLAFVLAVILGKKYSFFQ